MVYDIRMLTNMSGSKWQKCTKLLISGLVLTCLIVAIGAKVFTNQSSPHIYIALGDSVSSGFGLSGYAYSPQGVHSSIFFEKLKYNGFVDEYHNMAKSGFTTTMLLEMLTNLSADELKLFRNARVITLNIGGNNILLPFLDYLSGLQILAGADSIRTGATGLLSGVWGVIGEDGLSAGSVIAGIGSIVSGIGDLIAGTEEIIIGSSDIISIWRGSLSPELEAMLEEGAQAFAQEFTEIITWLKTNAQNAVLIVNTIHNPIPQEILGIISVPVSNWANALILSMNNIILKESEKRGYLMVDLHSYLLNRLYLTDFNLNPFSARFSFDLVHPNAEGHNLIAALHYASFMEYMSE